MQESHMFVSFEDGSLLVRILGRTLLKQLPKEKNKVMIA